MLLHEQLNFGEHLTYIANKLQKCLPKPLIPISKSLSHHISVMEKLSPDQQYNKSFHESLESLHGNASLTITGAIRDTWNENICQELGLESLMHRRFVNCALPARFLKINHHITFVSYYLS